MDENTLIKDELSETSNKKTKHSLWIIAPVAVAVAVVLGIVAMTALRMAGFVNPYEKGYIDITGRTAGDIAKDELTEYSLLPTDIIERIPFAIKKVLDI